MLYILFSHNSIPKVDNFVNKLIVLINHFHGVELLYAKIIEPDAGSRGLVK